MEIKRYNPMNDVLFKFIFGKEERKHITIDFINSMLDRDKEHEVVDITFKNVEIFPLAAEIKLTRLDVFCVLSTGERVDIEIQVVNHKNMGQRSLYYWAQMYLLFLKQGDDYKKLAPAITINLLQYRFLPQEEPHAMYGIYNPANMHRLTEDMELHFFEIPKFRKKPISEMTRAERWLAYFASQLDKQEAEEMGATAIKDAFNAADLFMQDEEQRLAYVSREMAIMDYQSDMNASREEGITDAVRRLYLNGEISSDTIMKTFGWTKEQVEALKAQN
ncbi:MAG TPA: transposase [Selenomonas sp.]|nr:transposase [Selenomonas sp.]